MSTQDRYEEKTTGKTLDDLYRLVEGLEEKIDDILSGVEDLVDVHDEALCRESEGKDLYWDEYGAS